MTTFRLAATPFEYTFPAARTALVVIDMQRDFIEPGGFGASLGNDVTLLHPTIAPIAALLAAWRERGWPVVHTREAHKHGRARGHECERNFGHQGRRGREHR